LTPPAEFEAAVRVLLLTSDLVFASKVAAAATRQGVTLETALGPAALVDKLAASPARLVIVDLNTARLDLADLVPRVRATVPAPAVLAFGPHVQEAMLAAAQKAGCDHVMSRGQFNAQMDAILARYAAD
jgi:DNA-binding NarL/FixJ family response regulator